MRRTTCLVGPDEVLGAYEDWDHGDPAVGPGELTAMNGDVPKPGVAAAQGSFAAAAREAEVARHRPQAVAVAADPILAPCTSIAAMRQGRSARCDPSRRLDPARRGAGRRIDGVIEVLGDDDEAREVHDKVETILTGQEDAT